MSVIFLLGAGGKRPEEMQGTWRSARTQTPMAQIHFVSINECSSKNSIRLSMTQRAPYFEPTLPTDCSCLNKEPMLEHIDAASRVATRVVEALADEDECDFCYWEPVGWNDHQNMPDMKLVHANNAPTSPSWRVRWTWTSAQLQQFLSAPYADGDPEYS